MNEPWGTCRACCGLAWVALLLVLQGCSRTAPAEPPPAPVAVVTAAKPIVREIVEFDEFSGRVAAVENAAVRARVSGYIRKVNFSEGAFVKEGQVLFELDREPLRIEVDRLSAELKRGQSAVSLAKSNADRGRRLVETNAISREEYETLLNTREQSEANVAVLGAGLQAVTLNYDYTLVRAPISGRVGRALVTAGNLITGNIADGTLLTTIVSLDPVHVIFDADENSYLRYLKLAREGTRVSGRTERKSLTMALSDESDFGHQGYLDFVDNQIESSTGTLRARGVFRNTAQNDLLPGMFARVRLPGSGSYRAVMIEDRAVATDLGRRVVMTVDESGTVRPRVIATGPLHEGLRIVRSGIGPDDLIVVDGLQRVRPGAKVQPTVVDMRGEPDRAARAAAAAPPAPAGGAGPSR